MPRAFIAVEIDATSALRRALAELEAMDRPVKAVAPENLHITLRFLGQTDECLFADLLEAVGVASDGIGPFDLHLVGMGAFPHARRPWVVWVGSDQDEPLKGIVDGLNVLIDALGFAGSGRPWSSHLTLARIKARPPQELTGFLDGRRSFDFGTHRVDRINLKTSTLSSAGPRYETVGSVRLKG